MRPSDRDIMRHALTRIALNTYGDTIPQVIAGDALKHAQEAQEPAGVEPSLIAHEAQRQAPAPEVKS